MTYDFTLIKQLRASSASSDRVLKKIEELANADVIDEHFMNEVLQCMFYLQKDLKADITTLSVGDTPLPTIIMVMTIGMQRSGVAALIPEWHLYASKELFDKTLYQGCPKTEGQLGVGNAFNTIPPKGDPDNLHLQDKNPERVKVWAQWFLFEEFSQRSCLSCPLTACAEKSPMKETPTHKCIAQFVEWLLAQTDETLLLKLDGRSTGNNERKLIAQLMRLPKWVPPTPEELKAQEEEEERQRQRQPAVGHG
jgi:hypothetical protein